MSDTPRPKSIQAFPAPILRSIFLSLFFFYFVRFYRLIQSRFHTFRLMHVWRLFSAGGELCAVRWRTFCKDPHGNVKLLHSLSGMIYDPELKAPLVTIQASPYLPCFKKRALHGRFRRRSCYGGAAEKQRLQMMSRREVQTTPASMKLTQVCNNLTWSRLRRTDQLGAHLFLIVCYFCVTLNVWQWRYCENFFFWNLKLCIYYWTLLLNLLNANACLYLSDRRARPRRVALLASGLQLRKHISSYQTLNIIQFHCMCRLNPVFLFFPSIVPGLKPLLIPVSWQCFSLLITSMQRLHWKVNV